MRAWGYALVALGGVFLVLFVLAELGGGHVGFLPFFVSAVIVLIGVQLARSGTGLVRTALAGATAGVAAVPTQMTQSLPMTPEIVAIVRRQAASTWRILLIVAGGAAGLMALMGGVLALLNAAPGKGAEIFGFLAAVGVVTGATILFVAWLSTGRQLARDTRATTYLRTSGPVQYVSLTTGGAMLRLADRAFLISNAKGITALAGMRSGTVDYTAFAHVILAAWNDDGRPVYEAPGYTSCAPRGT